MKELIFTICGFALSASASPFISYECEQKAEALVDSTTQTVCWKGKESIRVEAKHLAPPVEFIHECVQTEFAFSQVNFGIIAFERVEKNLAASKTVFGVPSTYGGWPRGDLNHASKGGLDCVFCESMSYFKGKSKEQTIELFVKSSGEGTLVIDEQEIEMDGCVLPYQTPQELERANFRAESAAK